ncbi:hypothetical protein B0J17DRAFT_440546 [Rhizoctonia solani]|nr:hypothetical protein B0J17DRAFT_440546 [Rhizoctonia solani]
MSIQRRHITDIILSLPISRKMLTFSLLNCQVYCHPVYSDFCRAAPFCESSCERCQSEAQQRSPSYQCIQAIHVMELRPIWLVPYKSRYFFRLQQIFDPPSENHIETVFSLD